jgi:hypothetical protein
MFVFDKILNLAVRLRKRVESVFMLQITFKEYSHIERTSAFFYSLESEQNVKHHVDHESLDSVHEKRRGRIILITNH